MLINAAVFINGKRKLKGVNVEVVGDEVIVTNRVSGAEMSRYSVVETAKVDMAWDVEVDGARVRLVAQQGCGCGGMKPYNEDPGYIGV